MSFMIPMPDIRAQHLELADMVVGVCPLCDLGDKPVKYEMLKARNQDGEFVIKWKFGTVKAILAEIAHREKVRTFKLNVMKHRTRRF